MPTGFFSSAASFACSLSLVSVAASAAPHAQLQILRGLGPSRRRADQIVGGREQEDVQVDAIRLH